MGIPVLDHLVIGSGNYQSLREISTLWDSYPQGDVYKTIPELTQGYIKQCYNPWIKPGIFFKL